MTSLMGKKLTAKHFGQLTSRGLGKFSKTDFFLLLHSLR